MTIAEDNAEALKKYLTDLVERLRMTADEVEQITPALPKCGLDTCECTVGGLDSLLLLFNLLTQHLGHAMFGVAGWQQHLEAAERLRIAQQN